MLAWLLRGRSGSLKAFRKSKSKIQSNRRRSSNLRRCLTKKYIQWVSRTRTSSGISKPRWRTIAMTRCSSWELTMTLLLMLRNPMSQKSAYQCTSFRSSAGSKLSFDNHCVLLAAAEFLDRPTTPSTFHVSFDRVCLPSISNPSFMRTFP